jgi:type IV fimbrial biogenesis protein FimT
MNAVVVQTPVDSVAYSFNGFGRAPSNGLNSDGTNVLTQIEVKSGGATEGRKMRIVITSGGEIRMCDPAVSTDSDDPRKCPL